MEGQGLAARVRAKYPGVYDDMTDEQLESAVVAKYPEYKDLVTPKPDGASGGLHPHARVGRMVTEALPTIGGAIGSALGTPMVGGAIGGAVGAAVRDPLRRAQGLPAPSSVGDVAADVAGSAAGQGLIGGAGKALGWLSKIASPQTRAISRQVPTGILDSGGRAVLRESVETVTDPSMVRRGAEALQGAAGTGATGLLTKIGIGGAATAAEGLAPLAGMLSPAAANALRAFLLQQQLGGGS